MLRVYHAETPKGSTEPHLTVTRDGVTLLTVSTSMARFLSKQRTVNEDVRDILARSTA